MSSSRKIEFLSPEQILEQEFDITYQDYETEESQDGESDFDDLETGRTAEIFDIAEPLDSQRMKQNNMQLKAVRKDEADYAASMQLSIYGGNNEVEMDSDEEASIIREIKAEITAQVRNEMQDELAVYKEARDKLKTPKDKPAERIDDNMDPKMKEAIIKMKKLDKILNKKIKKEKEVKRDRIMLQRRLKEELENMNPEGREELDKVKSNTEKFLALALPPSHNIEAEDTQDSLNDAQLLAIEYRLDSSRLTSGISIEDDDAEQEERDCVTPLFQTQVLDQSMNKKRSQTSAQSSQGEGRPSARSAGSDNSFDSQSLHSEATSKSTDSKGNRKKKKKNFIERNIQLSSDAANAIAMTQDEKDRISDLLKDLDALPEIPEDDDPSLEENPYQIAIPLGEGYLPTPDQMSRLEDIDSRLKMLLPPEDYESIASNTPRKIASHRYQVDLFSRTGILDMDSAAGQSEFPETNPREEALLQAKEQRDFKVRLREIEDELASLSSAVESEIESPSLSSHQLQDLLDECSRTMSRVTDETSTMSRSTNRSEDSDQRQLVSVTPLPKDVLDKLLADARQELMGRSSPDVHPEEGTFVTKDDLVLESISEETLRDLLRDSRTTSRAGSRPSSRSHHPAMNGGYTAGLRRVDSEEKENAVINGRGSGDRPRPFLPEIDPRGQLSTQKLNGGLFENGFVHNNVNDNLPSRPGSGPQRSAFVTRNSDDQFDIVEDYCEGSPTPHPPTSGRRASSGGRSRTMSPLKKSLGD